MNFNEFRKQIMRFSILPGAEITPLFIKEWWTHFGQCDKKILGKAITNCIYDDKTKFVPSPGEFKKYLNDYYEKIAEDHQIEYEKTDLTDNEIVWAKFQGGFVGYAVKVEQTDRLKNEDERIRFFLEYLKKRQKDPRSTYIGLRRHILSSDHKKAIEDNIENDHKVTDEDIEIIEKEINNERNP